MARSSLRATREISAKASGWAGGVNLRDAVNTLTADEARRMENGVLDEKGGFAKRLGCQAHGTFGGSGDRVLSMYTFYRGGAANPQVIIHTSAGALLYTNDPSATTVTWGTITTGVSATAPYSFETFRGKCYMSNGVDNYASWDGATYANFTSAPKGKYLRLWKDTMWVSGITGLVDRVYSSAAGDAENYPVANWVDIGVGDGDRVFALGSDGTYLIVFKRRRHMVIYDPVTFANRVVDYEKGCESHFSVVQFEATTYFLSRRGICRFLGDSPADLVSGNLDPLFQPDILNLGALSTSWAYTVGNRVCWALPEAGQVVPSMQIEYYPRLAGVTAFGNRGTGPWMFHRIPCGTFTLWRMGAVESLFGGSVNSNKVLHVYAPVGTDDGQSFKALLETTAYEFGEPVRHKYIRYLRLLGRGIFELQVKRDYHTAIYKVFPIDLSSKVDLWNDERYNEETWGPDSVFKDKRIMPDFYARQLSLIFTDARTDSGRRQYEVGSKEYTVTDGEWAIYGIVMEGAVVGSRV